ncbi:Inositol-tetrakisphosphate 1-kinase 3 [Euphorbia peplus]|nr:Inositol-tetrakisphosphate 1-kinase 3 [Euphorbia peplus]
MIIILCPNSGPKVNHDMIYIVGEATTVVRHFSLPNVTKCELAKEAGVFRFPRVSSVAASVDDAYLDSAIGKFPPRILPKRLAKKLRARLGLQLFNIDMIQEHGTKDVFYVIDINYFPG